MSVLKIYWMMALYLLKHSSTMESSFSQFFYANIRKNQKTLYIWKINLFLCLSHSIFHCKVLLHLVLKSQTPATNSRVSRRTNALVCLFISVPFCSTYPTSASDCCHTHYLSGTTKIFANVFNLVHPTNQTNIFNQSTTHFYSLLYHFTVSTCIFCVLNILLLL